MFVKGFWAIQKSVLISLCFLQYKYTKMPWKEISSTGCNVLEYFCVALSTDYVSDLREKSHAACTYDTNADLPNLKYLM